MSDPTDTRIARLMRDSALACPMSDQEVAGIIGLIRLRYPRHPIIPDATDQQAAMQAVIGVWRLSLKDVGFDAALRILERWFQTEKWPPDPSELRLRVLNEDGEREERIKRLRHNRNSPSAMSPGEGAELKALEAGESLAGAMIAHRQAEETAALEEERWQAELRQRWEREREERERAKALTEADAAQAATRALPEGANADAF